MAAACYQPFTLGQLEYPDRRWGPPSLLCNGKPVSFQGVKRPRRAINPPPPQLSAEVKERVELYLNSPSGSSWPLPARTSTFVVGILTNTFNSHKAQHAFHMVLFQYNINRLIGMFSVRYELFFSFFLSPSSFYLAIVGKEGYCYM